MNHGTTPPGFSTPAESWRHMLGGELAVLMRPIPFDGQQACDGNMAFTDRDDWTDDEAADLTDICESCRWLARCRDWAIAHERHTFMGGMSPVQRQRYRKMHRIQVVDRYSAELYGLARFSQAKQVFA